jgi:glycine betaine/choline ABC-type transport system substrate-binding protein
MATSEVKGEINSIVDALESRETMQALNARVDIDYGEPQQVARTFLESRDII